MDENSYQSERISIKNLLFTKAIPNYTLPIPTYGRPTFSCTDCGDKFLLQSSYEYHINRKSLKITYSCRYCHSEKIFFNRCNLLSHIRSHVFKSTTINVTDLKIEPLPLTFFNLQNNTCHEVEPLEIVSITNQDDAGVQCQEQPDPNNICYECNSNIFSTGIFYKDRAKHYTQYSNKIYSCPICLLTLPTECALKVHIRLHTQEPPYYCPDCGIHLANKSVVYPFSHDCESFRMMRVTAKLICLVKGCKKMFHPNDSSKHLRNAHLKSVYKCSGCSVACYKLTNLEKHLRSHKKKMKILEFFQCEICPGRLVIPGQIDRHMKSHENNCVSDVYPCWVCGMTFKLAKSLLHHQMNKHDNNQLKQLYGKSSLELNVESQPSAHYKGPKRCDKCFSTFTSQGIASVPDPCNCKCTPKIVCHLCKQSVLQDWHTIKEHYRKFHKEHVCLDVKIPLRKLIINEQNIGTIRKKTQKKLNRQKKTYHKMKKGPITRVYRYHKIATDFICGKCGTKCEDKQFLEMHMVTHKDPFMAYQCLECGESFIAKPSFSTHLLLKHGINDVSEYIDKKKCYNKESLHLSNSDTINDNEPLKENQCNICREEFCNSIDLEKHFRVHGMAFLKKTTTSKATSPDKV